MNKFDSIIKLIIVFLLAHALNIQFVLGQVINLKNDTCKANAVGFYKQSISIVTNDLLFERFVFNYTRVLNNQLFYDFTLGVHYSEPAIASGAFGFGDFIDETDIKYNSLLFRAGLKQYLKKRIFLGLSINCKYAFNDNYKYVFQDIRNSEISSKYKYRFGLLFKFGVVILKSKRLLSEIYLGIGIRKTYINKLVKGYYDVSTGETRYLETPKSINEVSFDPTFHLGLTFGLKN
jgi:hypothetical protein